MHRCKVNRSMLRLFWRAISLLLIVAMLLPTAPLSVSAQDCEGEACTEGVDVEQYVTYAMVESTLADDGQGVQIDWITAFESYNAGFNIVIENDGDFEVINDELIASVAVDSLLPQRYSYNADMDVAAFYLEQVTIDGESYRTGPMVVGERIGEVPEPSVRDWAAVREENETLAEERQASRAREINATLDAIRGPVPDADAPLVEQSAGMIGERDRLHLPLIAGGDEVRAAGTDAMDVVDGETIKLLVREKGIYRVSFEDIDTETNIDLAGIPSAYLALTNNGVPVRIRMVSAENAQGVQTWADGAFFEFIGEGIVTDYTLDNVYVLQVDRRNAFRTYRNLREPDAVEAVPDFYTESAVFEQNDQYGWVQSAPLDVDPYPWAIFNRSTNSPVSRAFDFTTSALQSEQSSEIQLEVWGRGEVDHKLEVAINGVPLATDLEYTGSVSYRPTIDIPASRLVNGTNSLELTVPANPSVQTDATFLNKFTIRYARGFSAVEGALAFSGDSKRFEVKALPSNDVVVYSIYRNRVWRHEVVEANASNGNFDITFHGWGDDAQYFVADVTSAVQTPVIEAGQSLDTDITSGTADYIMISHPNFMTALEPLKAERERDGYVVRIVNVDDIYAQYNHSILDASAIQDYIKYAINSMDAEYFLLVGDDTIDPFQYFTSYFGPLVSFLPSLYGPVISWNRAAVDPLYTDVNDDGIPDAKIGRFPVNTVTETTWIVNKTLNYTDNGVGSIFTADEGFGVGSDGYINTMPADWQAAAQTAYLSDELTGNAAFNVMKAALEDGVTLVSYLGHGNSGRWTLAGQLLRTDKVDLIENTNLLALFLQWGCNTGFYGYYTETVSEALLVNENHGAIATFAATGNTYESTDSQLARRLTPLVIEPGVTIGSAIQEARLNMIEEYRYSEDVITGLSLLGDPTLVLVPVSAP